MSIPQMLTPPRIKIRLEGAQLHCTHLPATYQQHQTDVQTICRYEEIVAEYDVDIASKISRATFHSTSETIEHVLKFRLG